MVNPPGGSKTSIADCSLSRHDCLHQANAGDKRHFGLLQFAELSKCVPHIWKAKDNLDLAVAI